MTGFTKATRKLIIERDHGICQWCGELVTVADYSLQHRRARGMGGSKSKAANSPANGVVVHGSGTTGCHGWIESHPDDALERGFRVYQGKDPRQVALVDWAGRAWWLFENGGRERADSLTPF